MQQQCPYKFTAGDSLTFSVPSNPTYPTSAGWTLAFLMMFPGWTPQSFPGVAQGDGSFTVTVTPANTDTIIPEEYGTAYVYSNAGSGLRKTIYGGTVWVTPDPTQAIAPTAAMLTLQAFQAAYTDLASHKINSASVDGNSYTEKDLEQIRKQIAFMQVQVNQEMNQLKALQDQPVADRIITEFVPPLACPPYQGLNGLWGYP